MYFKRNGELMAMSLRNDQYVEVSHQKVLSIAQSGPLEGQKLVTSFLSMGGV